MAELESEALSTILGGMQPHPELVNQGSSIEDILFKRWLLGLEPESPQPIGDVTT